MGLWSQRCPSFTSVCGHRVEKCHLLVAQHNRQRSLQSVSLHQPSTASRDSWDRQVHRHTLTCSHHPESLRHAEGDTQMAGTRRSTQDVHTSAPQRSPSYMTTPGTPKVTHTHTHTHTRKCKRTHIGTPTASWRRAFQIERHWTQVHPGQRGLVHASLCWSALGP